MTTDDDVDTRLRAAGSRWRAEHDTPAAPHFDFASAATAAADDGPEVEIPLVPTVTRRGRRRRWRWLAGGGVAAAAAVAAVLVAVLSTGGSGGHHPEAATGTAAAGLDGVEWRLVSASAAAGSVPSGAFVAFTKDTIKGNDGCNSFSGPVRVDRDELILGDIATTAMGCLGSRDDAAAAIHAVIAGTVRYTVGDGTLTLTKPGAGRLVFTAQPEPVAVTDPSALAGTSWRLQSIGTGPGGAVSGSADYAKAALTFPGTGRIGGGDGCNGFGGAVTFGTGTMTVGPLVSTTMACRITWDQQVRQVLSGRVTWSVTGDLLTVTHDGVGTLIYARVEPDAATVTPGDLTGTWRLTATAPVGGAAGNGSNLTGVTLTVDGTDRLSAFDGCENVGSDVTVGAGTLEVEALHSTFAGTCANAEVASFVRSVLQGSLTWSIGDGALTLDKSGVGSLTFARATSR